MIAVNIVAKILTPAAKRPSQARILSQYLVDWSFTLGASV